jgi:hypothetical protein
METLFPLTNLQVIIVIAHCQQTIAVAVETYQRQLIKQNRDKTKIQKRDKNKENKPRQLRLKENLQLLASFKTDVTEAED